MMTTLTREQQSIADAAATGDDVVVDACAGTGKTTTLRYVSTNVLADKRIKYLVFNKSAQIQAEATFPRNTSATTTYAMANGEVRRSSYGPLLSKLGGKYVPFHVTIRELGIEPLRVNGTAISASTLAVATVATIDAFCRTTDTTIEENLVAPLPNHDAQVNAQIAEAVTHYARKGWDDLLTEHGAALKFEHKHYLKLWGSGMVTDGQIPRLPGLGDGDVVMYDEAQDADPLMARIVEAQTHLQRIYVGDEAQAINRFAGAVNAMRAFSAPHRLPLTQSWRFGPRVAEAANVFLAALGSPNRLTGNPDRDTHITDALTADTVLCRSNAGMIGEVLDLQQAGKSVAVVGGVKEAKAFATACAKLQRNQPNTHPELAAFPTWDSLVDYVTASDTPTPLSTVVKVVQKYGPDNLISALEDCVDERTGNADVRCSTAHRAKGGEWGRVRMAHDFTVPLAPTSPAATKEPELENRDDQMLAYVAVTRGMESVNVGSLYDDRPERRPALSITAAELDYADQVEKSRTKTLQASPQELATEFIDRLPARLNGKVAALLESSGHPEHELIRQALAVYVDMHDWG